VTAARLEQLLAGFGSARIVVVGDFFLDQYLEIDPALDETSLETGLAARQVVSVRGQPGGAGNVVANLVALGLGEVICLGFIGDDGEGYELTRALGRLGANTTGLLACRDRSTPTYRKPVVRPTNGGLSELERLDTKNRRPIPPEMEEALIARLRDLAPQVQAVIAQDQVQEVDCGGVTRSVREALAGLAREHPSVTWFADSRVRAGEFREVIVKPNREEVCAAAHPGEPAHAVGEAVSCARSLSAQTGAPVYLTMGEDGIAVVTEDDIARVPAVKVDGDIDIVGAGDSATAGIVSALASGAGLREAAVVGNVVASVTIQQLGATGTASQEQVRARFAESVARWGNIAEGS
jgi:rfaE bifunctional protein kinase chain/domain